MRYLETRVAETRRAPADRTYRFFLVEQGSIYEFHLPPLDYLAIGEAALQLAADPRRSSLTPPPAQVTHEVTSCCAPWSARTAVRMCGA